MPTTRPTRFLRNLLFATALPFAAWAVLAADRPAASRILWSTDWSADDQYMAVGGERFLRVHDGATGEPVQWNAPDISDTARFVQWHATLPLLAISAGPDDTGIYNIQTGDFTPLRTSEGTRGIAWNADHTKLATAGNDGAVQIWSSHGELLHRHRPEKGKSLTGVAWHPTRDILVTVGEFITVHRGDALPIKRWRHRPAAKGLLLLLSVQWHPSGEFFAVGDYGNPDTGEPPALQFWSDRFQLIKSIEIEGGAELRNMDWNDAGTRLATASDQLRIWDRSGRLLHEGDPEHALWGVKWSRSENTILTSSIEEEIDVWTPTARRAERVHSPMK